MMAIGVNNDGRSRVIGTAESFTEFTVCWRELHSWLKSCGLHGVRIFTGNKSAAMVSLIAKVFSDATRQNRLGTRKAPRPKRSRQPPSSWGQGEKGCQRRAKERVETLTRTRTLSRDHRSRIRTDNAMGQLNRRIRLRIRLMETFPDGRSAPMFVAASLKYVAESEWGSRRHPNVTLWGNGRTGNRPVVLSESAQVSRRYPQRGSSGHHTTQEDRLSASTRWPIHADAPP